MGRNYVVKARVNFLLEMRQIRQSSQKIVNLDERSVNQIFQLKNAVLTPHPHKPMENSNLLEMETMLE